MLNWRIFGYTSSKSSKETVSVGEKEQELIRERAYSLWEDDGCPQGKSDYYWFKAAEQIAAKRTFLGSLSTFFKKIIGSMANKFRTLRIKPFLKKRSKYSGT